MQRFSRYIALLALFVLIGFVIFVQFYIREERIALPYEKISPHYDSAPHVIQLTDEWQTLEEGLAVPPGFHVRVDVTTGKKEAKLLSEELKDDHSSEVTVVPIGVKEEEAPSGTPAPPLSVPPWPSFRKVALSIQRMLALFRSVQAKKGNAGTNGDKKKVESELPDGEVAVAELPTDITFEAEPPNDSPVETELPTDITFEAEPPNDSPVETELPNDSPVETELPNDSPVETELPNESPVETELPNDSPVETELPNDSPVETELPNDSPVETELPYDRPVETELPNDRTVDVDQRKAETPIDAIDKHPTLTEENVKKVEEKLEQLEFATHQVDSGSNFILKNDGYRKVILPTLSMREPSLRIEGLRLLGAAAQNNPDVQTSLVQQGAVAVLLRTLSSDPSSEVKHSASFGLSCLLRGSPAAQMQFLKKQGVHIVVQQFISEAGNVKLQLHVLWMFRSLLEEQRSAIATYRDCTESKSDDCQLAEEMYHKYLPLSYNERLEKEGWCPALVGFLQSNVDNTEVVEEVTQDMVFLARKICYRFYKESFSEDNTSELATWLRNSHQLPQLQNTVSQIRKIISKYSYLHKVPLE